jgi:hypothetical protein
MDRITNEGTLPRQEGCTRANSEAHAEYAKAKLLAQLLLTASYKETEGLLPR